MSQTVVTTEGTTVFPNNVIYEIENEHNYAAGGSAWANRWAPFIKTYTGNQRLVSYSSLLGDLLTVAQEPSNQVDIINKHYGTPPDLVTLHNEIVALSGSWDQPPSATVAHKAVNVDEFGTNVTDPVHMRQLEWVIVTSGGHFHTEDTDPAARADDAALKIRAFVAYTFESHDPQPWNFVGSKPTAFEAESSSGYCMVPASGASGPRDYVCYYPVTPSPVTLNVPPGRYYIKWWNPRDGSTQSAPYVTVTGSPLSISLTPPGPPGADWVLFVRNDPDPADLSIVITDNRTAAAHGQTVTYTITASNLGPSAVTGATVTDDPPSSSPGPYLTSVSWTCTASGGGSCAPGGMGRINDSTVSLPPGGTATYSLTGTISPPSGCGTESLTNVATITAPPWVLDSYPGNNSRSDTDSILPPADLAVTKTDNSATSTLGQVVTYTITASNHGPCAVTGATVTDNPPSSPTAPNLTGVTWTCFEPPPPTPGSPPNVCAASGTGSINDTVSLPPGGNVTYSLTGTVSGPASGSLTNVATITALPSALDPDLGNNSATDKDTLLPPVDLAVTITADSTTAQPGQELTYTIMATNNGPSNATGASVTDQLPSSLTGATWNCTGAFGGTCGAPSGSGSINQTVNLPVGGSVTYSLWATVATNPSAVRNKAVVAPPAGLGDPNPANNSATHEAILRCFVGEPVIVPDGRAATTTIGPNATARFAAALRAKNSYSLEFINLTGTTAPGTVTVFSGDDGCSLTSTQAVRDTTGIDPQSGPGGARVSFGAGGTATLFRARLVNGTVFSIPLSLSLAETTMYSALWSTWVNYDTYYTFQNTTSALITGTLNLLDARGAVIMSKTLAIPAGQTVSLNTLTMGVGRNRTGTAQFTHDGPPGAVTAEANIADFTTTPAYQQPVKFEAVREAR